MSRLIVSADGKVLAASGRLKAVRCWDLTTRKPLATIPGDNANNLYRCVSLSADGSVIAVATADGKVVKLYDTKSGAEKGSVPGFKTEVRALALSPDGSKLAVTEQGKFTATAYPIDIFDARTGTKLGTLPGHEKWITAMTFSPDGKFLATGGNDNVAKLWAIE